MVEYIANTRNEALEFAKRTRRNLAFIENAAKEQADVHVVTQLTLSLLGLVVFPREKMLFAHAEKVTIDKMIAEGWPRWSISKDDRRHDRTTNLKVLLERLRNAICHARIVFDSDSRSINDVSITVEDGPRPKGGSAFEADWIATISAADLRTFCYRFFDFVEDSIG
ncbi:MAG TPA: HEPN family nuclease [Acidobacteriaceae bacterium]|nr:HEPN family nuclease [Acidobacteriaceae bacterium]